MSMLVKGKQKSDSEPVRGLVPAFALLVFSMTLLVLMVVKVLWV